MNGLGKGVSIVFYHQSATDTLGLKQKLYIPYELLVDDLLYNHIEIVFCNQSFLSH